MSLSRRLRKNFAITLIAPIGAIIFLSAQGIAQVAEVGLNSEAKDIALQAAMQRRPHRAPPPPFHETTADAILAHNPFDSTRLAPTRDPLVPEDDDSDPLHAPACEGVKVLAIIASADPDFSFAAFQDGKLTEKVLRRRGGDVGDRTVAFIGWDRVWLGRADRLCQAAMFEPTSTEDPHAHAPARPTVGGGAPLDPVIAKGIEKVSATEFRIDRGIVPRILEHQAELSRPQMALEQQGGKVAGVRLSGVKPDSLLGALGIENGDRLETINGIDVSNTSALVEMYARLAQLDHLTAQVTRGESAVRLEYDIR
ncbi:MAG: type II secretion system protein GspC [Polyangiaceae bacterium]